MKDPMMEQNQPREGLVKHSENRPMTKIYFLLSFLCIPVFFFCMGDVRWGGGWISYDWVPEAAAHSSHLRTKVVLHSKNKNDNIISPLFEEDQFEKDSNDVAVPPVIGVMALPMYGPNPSEFAIAASYIKWLESAGARTIVIPYFDNETSVSPQELTQQRQLLDDVFSQIHMVFLTGGASSYPQTTLNYLLDKIVAHNRQGMYFPVWGTCLGFEFLIDYVSGQRGRADVTVLEDGYVASNVSWPLEQVVVEDLYRNPAVYQAVQQHNVTFHNHQLGISPTKFVQNRHLNQTFVITSQNHDQRGRPFVSSIEPRKSSSWASFYLPFYGVQYHPEKNAFEYGILPSSSPAQPYEVINHSPTGVAFSLALAQLVVQLARRSQRANPTHLYTKVTQFPPVYKYPILVGTEFEQVYRIPPPILPNYTAEDDRQS